MTPRKTISVDFIKNMANNVLLNSEDDYVDGRLAVANMVEQVLIKTGNYKGFTQLTAKDMESSANGTTVGIDPNLDFSDTDFSRVRYF